MTAADPTAALASYLLTTEVDALTSGRVFRPKLPKAEVESKQMPRACVVIRPAGGYTLFGGGQVPMGDPRMDIFCYGATALEAQQLARTVAIALRALTRQTFEGCVLYWARVTGGPLPLVDPSTQWDYCLVSAQVMHAERAV